MVWMGPVRVPKGERGRERDYLADVRLLQALQDMRAGRRRCVARRVVGALAARQAGDLGVEIGVEEEQDRAALAIGELITRCRVAATPAVGQCAIISPMLHDSATGTG